MACIPHSCRQTVGPTSWIRLIPPAVGRLRKLPPRAHPHLSGGFGSDAPGLGARPYTTPHQGASAVLPDSFGCPQVRTLFHRLHRFFVVFTAVMSVYLSPPSAQAR